MARSELAPCKRCTSKFFCAGKAWLRTSSPYVALPFDPGRKRPELVGFSAPSRLAQRDVAKACYRANSVKKFARFISKCRNQAPGAEPTPLAASLGGRAPD